MNNVNTAHLSTLQSGRSLVSTLESAKHWNQSPVNEAPQHVSRLLFLASQLAQQLLDTLTVQAVLNAGNNAEELKCVLDEAGGLSAEAAEALVVNIVGGGA